MARIRDPLPDSLKSPLQNAIARERAETTLLPGDDLRVCAVATRGAKPRGLIALALHAV